MASSQGDVRSSPMAYPAVRSLPKLPLPLRPEAEYLIVELLVRPVAHQAQSLVIALRSPATKRSSDLDRYSPDIHHHCKFSADDEVNIALCNDVDRERLNGARLDEASWKLKGESAWESSNETSSHCRTNPSYCHFQQAIPARQRGITIHTQNGNIYLESKSSRSLRGVRV